VARTSPSWLADDLEGVSADTLVFSPTDPDGSVLFVVLRGVGLWRERKG
jgi:hypothetical protein